MHSKESSTNPPSNLPAAPVVRMRIWSSGAYALSSTGADDAASLLEYDGRDGLHLVDLDAKGLQETVIRRRLERDGLVLRSSRLSLTAAGDFEWERKTETPRVRRTERWSRPAQGPGSWQREDLRSGRTTRYVRLGDGGYRGVSTTPGGAALWQSTWQWKGRDRLVGAYLGPGGADLGILELGAGGSHTMSWNGPLGSGTLSTGGGTDEGPRTVTIDSTKDGSRSQVTRTFEDATGRGDEVGSRSQGISDGLVLPAATWVRIYVNDDADNPTGQHDDGHSTVEFGTEFNPGGVTNDYTTRTHDKPDGSSSWDRSDVYSNGDTASAAGARDTQGNSSETDVHRSADGSTTIRTTSIDKDGNGTVHVTTIGPNGKVTFDQTRKVVNNKVVDDAPADTPTDDSPDDPDEDDPDDDSNDDPDDKSDDDGDKNDGSDTDPVDPDDPDHPDPDVDSSTGMPVGNDDDDDDEGPSQEGNPQGRLAAVDWDAILALAASAWQGDDGLDTLGDTDARYARWFDQLNRVIAAGGTIGSNGGDGSNGGGGDELDNLGAPVGFKFGGGTGVAPDDDLDDLGRPTLDLDVTPRPQPGSSGGATPMASLRALAAGMAAGSVAVAGSARLLAGAG